MLVIHCFLSKLINLINLINFQFQLFWNCSILFLVKKKLPYEIIRSRNFYFASKCCFWRELLMFKHLMNCHLGINKSQFFKNIFKFHGVWPHNIRCEGSPKPKMNDLTVSCPVIGQWNLILVSHWLIPSTQSSLPQLSFCLQTNQTCPKWASRWVAGTPLETINTQKI